MFCPNCGAETTNSAAFCMRCGCPVSSGQTMAAQPPAPSPVVRDEAMCTVTKVFLILGCISIGWLLIPLAWCIPITVRVFQSLNYGWPMSTGLKVCTLLFVNLIAGILLLCMNEDQQYY